jgi:CRP/FNR family transcriptional regulator, cyclic AMP receptor protein
MLDRFGGDAGSRRLAEAICRQSLMNGVLTDVAHTIAQQSEVLYVESGSILIEQGSSTNDIYFILAGSFAVLVNGREVAQRRAEQQVGEMALIDPKARRSAVVVALEDSVVARLVEAEFSVLANENPIIWKNLACELADRLRQRNVLVRQRNDVARIFIGSSKESLDIANALQLGLAHNPFIVSVWTNGVFGPSIFPIEALERVAAESDFAILVLGPDDRVISRRRKNLAPRDNVILELGLFIGAVGHRRVFLVIPEALDVKIPTDVLGVTPVKYSTDVSLGPARFERACSEIRDAVTLLGTM